MKQEPLISILMNCYNGEEYLRAALDSVMTQTYRNWELIFWDNRSTDGSATICKEIGDSRVRYFLANEHTELGIARIKAFQEIRGDFVAILDADDIAHPDRLTTQVAFLTDNPDVALVGSWIRCIDDQGRVFREFKPPTDQRELLDCLGWTNPIAHSSTMYRHRQAICVGGYSHDFIHSSDYELVLALAQHYKVAVIGDFLCQLRFLSSSMSRSKKYQAIMAREGLILFQRAADSLPLSAKSRRLNRRALSITKVRLGLSMIYDGCIWSGLNLIIWAILSKPSLLWGNGPVRRFFGKSF